MGQQLRGHVWPERLGVEGARGAGQGGCWGGEGGALHSASAGGCCIVVGASVLRHPLGTAVLYSCRLAHASPPLHLHKQSSTCADPAAAAPHSLPRQVRGKDFRHEKTKKKRGSYKGGEIDPHARCSYKFEDSGALAWLQRGRGLRRVRGRRVPQGGERDAAAHGRLCALLHITLSAVICELMRMCLSLLVPPWCRQRVTAKRRRPGSWRLQSPCGESPCGGDSSPLHAGQCTYLLAARPPVSFHPVLVLGQPHPTLSRGQSEEAQGCGSRRHCSAQRSFWAPRQAHSWSVARSVSCPMTARGPAPTRRGLPLRGESPARSRSLPTRPWPSG